MLKVILRPDGSVSDAVADPDIGAAVRPETETTLFPLDGLPGSVALRAQDRMAESGPDSWTGGFAVAGRGQRRGTFCAYRGHLGARPLFYHHLPCPPLLATGPPGRPPPPL